MIGGINERLTRAGVVGWQVCWVVAARAARVAASAVAAILEHAGKAGAECVVGIDGSVFKLYPGFKREMEATLQVRGRRCASDGLRIAAAEGAAAVRACAARVCEESARVRERTGLVRACVCGALCAGFDGERRRPSSLRGEPPGASRLQHQTSGHLCADVHSGIRVLGLNI